MVWCGVVPGGRFERCEKSTFESIYHLDNPQEKKEEKKLADIQRSDTKKTDHSDRSIDRSERSLYTTIQSPPLSTLPCTSINQSKSPIFLHIQTPPLLPSSIINHHHRPVVVANLVRLLIPNPPPTSLDFAFPGVVVVAPLPFAAAAALP